MLHRPPEPSRSPHPPGALSTSNGPADPSAVLRHDLRSLLTPIRGRAQLLARLVERERGPGSERLLTQAAEIERATETLAARIDMIGSDETAARIGTAG